jgi:transcriptional accessory protein Tex/SPT6
MKSMMVWVVGAGLVSGSAWATVDLNSASANQLQNELGLSRTQAMSVIERRERQPFQSPDELSSVNGIDSSKAEQLKGKLTTAPPGSAASNPTGTGPQASKVAKAKAHKAKKPKAAKSARKSKAKKAKTPPANNTGVGPTPRAQARQKATRGFTTAMSVRRPSTTVAPRVAL